MRLKAVLAGVCAILLASCGGGGGSEAGPDISSADIRSLTGAGVPVETPAAQRARSSGIVSRADSLIVSTIYGETSHSALPTFRLGSQCTGTQCTISEPRIGYSETIRLSDFEVSTGSTTAVGTKHGVTLMSWTEQDMGASYTTFGAWMSHSGFAVEYAQATEQEIRIGLRSGVAGGNLTGTQVTGSATWLGVMVGTPATGSGRGDRLQGDAALNYDVSAGGGIDVAFSSIKNIDRGIAHSTPTVLFVDIPITSRGTFEAGFVGNRIQGGFYGPGHAEAAGVFEQSNIVGAFGARRQ